MTIANEDPRPEPARLGSLEQQVMDTLWDQGPLSIRQIINKLAAGPAYTTIATVLANLERKQLVTPHKDGRSVRYESRYTREMHAAQLMEHALSTSDDRAASIVHFIDAIDQRDVQLLRDYLDKHKGDT